MNFGGLSTVEADVSIAGASAWRGIPGDDREHFQPPEPDPFPDLDVLDPAMKRMLFE